VFEVGVVAGHGVDDDEAVDLVLIGGPSKMINSLSPSAGHILAA
jgi:hypothetical protein